MLITRVPGTHSEEDEIILVTTEVEEPILLEDVFRLVSAFAENELKRIRAPPVRQEIIDGVRPFMFEDKLIKVIELAKKDAQRKLQ